MNIEDNTGRSKSAVPKPKNIAASLPNFGTGKYNIYVGKQNELRNKSPVGNSLIRTFNQIVVRKEQKTYSELLKEKIEPVSHKDNLRSPEKQNNRYEYKCCDTHNHGHIVLNKNAVNSNKNPKSVSAQSHSVKNQNNEMVKVHLRRIFEFYCQFGERMNMSFLKSHKYQKFAIDADILDSTVTKTKLEIIFSSENKTKFKSQMDFDTFMNSLIKVSELKFMTNKNDILNKFTNKQASSLHLLLKYHIWPLYERIFEVPAMLHSNTNKSTNDNKRSTTSDLNNYASNKVDSNNNKDIRKQIEKSYDTKQSKGHETIDLANTSTSNNNILNTSVNVNKLGLSTNSLKAVNNLTNLEDKLGNPEIEEVLKAVAPILYEIYKVYFPWETSMSENEDFVRGNSSKAFLVFVKDFGLCPLFVSKPAAFQIFQIEITNCKKDSESNDSYAYILKNIEVNPLGRTNNKNTLGKYLTFIKFIKIICKIADFGFEKNGNSCNYNYNTLNTSGDNLNNSNSNISMAGTKKLTLTEKICFTFERMEMSEGFLTLEQKTNKTHSTKTSRVIPQEILDNVRLGLIARLKEEEESLNDLSNLNINDAQSAELVQKNHRLLKLKRYNLGNLRDLFEHTHYILQKYGNQLSLIFKYYCSFGDPFNSTALKTNKFCKFLKEAGLIKQKAVNAYFNSLGTNMNTSFSSNSNSIVNANANFGIKMNEIDIIFFKISGFNEGTFALRDSSKSVNKSTDHFQMCSISDLSPTSFNTNFKKRGSVVNSNAKLDLIGFVNAIEIISLILSPNKNELEALDIIFKNNILPLLDKLINKNNETYQIILNEKNKNKEFAEVLSILHKSLTPIYRFYHNKNGYMSSESFFKFCADFAIFPEIVSKPKLNLFFKTTLDKEDILFESGENEYIDQQTLVFILAQCAFDFSYRTPEPSSVEKILIFIEKISLSEGTNRMVREYGQTRLQSGESLDILSLFKTYFPHYFQIPEVKKKGFFDVLNHKEM